MRVLAQFDTSIAEALSTRVRNRANFRAHLDNYRSLDDVWTFVLSGPTFRFEHDQVTADKVKIVACKARVPVTEAILEKIPPNNSKLTYVYDRYLFHYICEDGLIYMCMADDSFGRRIPFAFLQDIKEKFLAQYGQQLALESLLPYSLNEFKTTLAKQMEYFSTSPDADRIKHVQGEIEQVKDVMVQNIERVLERGERIELLVDKTDNLNQQAFVFKRRSTMLKRTMWWKNVKLMVILGVVVIALIYLLISAACGFPLWSSCRG
ncbi:Vesicle-associated membrane protein [Entomortierella beljakovae]|nr:Vesicle-associated membrane protein [Entomortierella beljakovae]